MKKQLNKGTLIVLLVFVAVILSVGGVVAKYVYSYVKQANVKSPEFYFESDLLTEEGASYSLNPGTNEVQFVLKNHPDSLRFSTNEINFTLSLSGTAGATLSQLEGTISAVQNGSVTITISNLVDGGSYNVTVLGDSGYEKTLSASFTVKSTQPLLYKRITKTLEYVELTVWTENLAGEVLITFPLGLIPDNTREGMEGVQTPVAPATHGSFTNDFEKYYSRTYRFIITANYDGSTNFTATCGTIEAIEYDY